VQKEYLSAPVQLALHGIANETFVILSNDGFNREPIVRRSLDGAHIPRARSAPR